MSPKARLATMLAILTFIFVSGLLAIFSVYLLKNTFNLSYFNNKTIIMKKFIKNNKKKLPKKDKESMKKM